MSVRPPSAALALLVLGLAACNDTSNRTTFSTSPSSASVPTPVPPNLPPPTPVPTPGPNAPVVGMHTEPSPPTGPAPLNVHFNACKSFDPDGDKLEFTYTFGDGRTVETRQCRHAHTYFNAGSYAASVCASDGAHTTCRSAAVAVD